MSALILATLIAASGGFLLWQRRARAADPAALRVAARLSLAPHAGLALIEADDDRLLIAWGEATPHLIARVATDGSWEMPPADALLPTPAHRVTAIGAERLS